MHSNREKHQQILSFGLISLEDGREDESKDESKLASHSRKVVMRY
jgi:hypothetical protein